MLLTPGAFPADKMDLIEAGAKDQYYRVERMKTAREIEEGVPHRELFVYSRHGTVLDIVLDYMYGKPPKNPK